MASVPQWLGCWCETYEANTRIAFGSIRSFPSHANKTMNHEGHEVTRRKTGNSDLEAALIPV